MLLLIRFGLFYVHTVELVSHLHVYCILACRVTRRRCNTTITKCEPVFLIKKLLFIIEPDKGLPLEVPIHRYNMIDFTCFLRHHRLLVD